MMKNRKKMNSGILKCRCDILVFDREVFKLDKTCVDLLNGEGVVSGYAVAGVEAVGVSLCLSGEVVLVLIAEKVCGAEIKSCIFPEDILY